MDKIIKWWKELVDEKHDEKHKGQRARLRRCALNDVFLNPDYIYLKRDLGQEAPNDLHVIASLLSFVDDTGDATKTLAEAMVKGSDRPAVSEIRFRRLLACETCEELHPQLLRALKILKCSSSIINLDDLIRSIRFWDDKTKRRWAEDYYGTLK